MRSGLLIAAFVAFAIFGGVFGLVIFRGWRRRGYFTIAATVLIALGIFLSFQALGAILFVALKFSGLTKDNGLLIVNGISQLLVMLGGTVLVSRMAGQDPFAVFRLQGFGETRAGTYLLAIPIILAAQFFGEAISALWTHALSVCPFFDKLQAIENVADQSMEGLVTANSLGSFIMVLLMVAVVPAFAEETLFRGFTQSNIERSGKNGPRPMVALFVTSFLFAAYHTSAFKLPGLFVLGAALGWMAYRTNNLFVGSLGHALNNGLIVTALYLVPDSFTSAAQKKLVDSASMSVTDALIAAAIWLPALIAALYWFARQTEPNTARLAPYEEYEEWRRETEQFEFDSPYHDNDSGHDNINDRTGDEHDAEEIRPQ